MSDDQRAPAAEPKIKIGKKSKGSPDALINKLSSDSLIVDFTDMKQCFLTDSSDFLGNLSIYSKNQNGFVHSLALRDRDINTLISTINKPSDNISNALSITSGDYSHFVPKIQLYKVLYSGARTFEGEAPIPFSTDSSSTIENILSSKSGRGDDVGLVDFSVNFEHSNPFAASRMVNGSIRILFQNGESLTKDRVLNVSSQGGGQTPFRFSDLISRRGQSPREFAGDHYRIRADIGYQSPGISPDDLNPSLVEQLESMNLSLILELVDYDLSFEQNGAVTLEISYRSYVEAVLDRSFYDIFTITPNPKFTKYKEGLENDLKRTKQEKENLEANGAREDGGFLEDAAEYWLNGGTDEEALERQKIREAGLHDKLRDASAKAIKTEGELTTAVGANKINMYSRILTYLYDNDKVRKIVIPKEDLLYYSEEYKDSVKQSIQAAGLGNLPSAIFAKDPTKAIADETVAIDQQEVQKRSRQALQESASAVAKGTGESFANKMAAKAKEIANKENDGKVNEEIVKKATGDTFIDLSFQISGFSEPDKADGNMTIYWFYFGDLMTAVVETAQLSTKMEQDHIGFMFGNALLPGKRNRNSEISLLDVPISLEAFLKFFKKTYIDKDVTRYSLNNFIRDVTQQLLLPSMNNRCFGESVHRPVTIKTSTLEVGTFGSLTGEIHATNPFPTNSDGAPKRIYAGGTDSTRPLTKLASNAVLRKRNANQRYYYTLVYVSETGLPAGLNGDTVKDAAKGIYHFYIGADRGLVKEVSFSKAKKNFQAEAMAQKAVASGDEFAEIFNLFNVDIEMLGNTLLKPGCHIFVNPTLTGIGAKTSGVLGLGGYYLVLGVSNQLSKDGWSTSINAEAVSRISDPKINVFNPASAEQISGGGEKVEVP
jgi:hypothetical protein